MPVQWRGFLLSPGTMDTGATMLPPPWVPPSRAKSTGNCGFQCLRNRRMNLKFILFLTPTLPQAWSGRASIPLLEWLGSCHFSLAHLHQVSQPLVSGLHFLLVLDMFLPLLEFLQQFPFEWLTRSFEGWPHHPACRLGLHWPLCYKAFSFIL